MLTVGVPFLNGYRITNCTRSDKGCDRHLQVVLTAAQTLQRGSRGARYCMCNLESCASVLNRPKRRTNCFFISSLLPNNSFFIHLSVAVQPLVGPWPPLQFRNLFYTAGRTP
jgi:hypothetical protein